MRLVPNQEPAKIVAGFERATRVHCERLGASTPEYAVTWVNGEAAILTLVSGRILFATVLHLDGEKVFGVYRIMNPDKLARLGHPTLLPPSGF